MSWRSVYDHSGGVLPMDAIPTTSFRMKNPTAILLALTFLLTGPALADEPVQAQAAEPDPQPIRVIDKKAVLTTVEDVKGDAKAEETKEDAADAADAAEEKSPDDADDASEQEQPSEADLRKKMRELELELQAARNKFQEKANEQRDKVKNNALEALEDIKLAKNPTRKQCEEYVAELRKACAGRRSFSSSDPATKKLKELPAEHYDLLVTEMANNTSLRYYANYAMRDMDPEQLRERFVKSIDQNPNNIGIIVMHGWVEDVRPTIIEHISAADGSVSPAWFQAAVELDEPKLYPKLHEIATQSRYASQFINMLEMLPDYDLAHTVEVCWKRAREGKLSVSYSTFAAKAASYGNVDALGALIDTLRTSSSYMSHSSSYNMRRTNVLRYIDYRGSNTDIQQWYKTNKDKLVFDRLRQRFIVPEDF